MKDVEKKSLGDKYLTHMKDINQPDISTSTQKLPYKKTPEYKAYQKAYHQTPEYKAKQKELDKAYRQTPEYKAKQKAWKKANPKKVLAAKKTSHEKRLKRDPLYAATVKLRSAVYNAFHRIGKNKPADTQTLLGCSWEEAKAHIESLFKEGMTWENHGLHGWHIDHIVPVDYFVNVLKNLDSMNLISNLQPLWAEENREKSNKIKDLD